MSQHWAGAVRCAAVCSHVASAGALTELGYLSNIFF